MQVLTYASSRSEGVAAGMMLTPKGLRVPRRMASTSRRMRSGGSRTMPRKPKPRARETASTSSELANPHTAKNDRILAAEEVADLGSQGNRQGPAHRPSNTLRSTTAWLCCSSWAAYIRVSLPRRAIARSSARLVRFARSSAA